MMNAQSKKPDPRRENVVVQLRDLTSSPELPELTSLFIASPLHPVRDLVVIADIEEISGVGPDTIIVLTPEASSGSWMISAALRYAWERRACTLVVPEHTSTETVVDLARRLGVSLLTSSTEMLPLALRLATQIGVARAGLITRLQNFTASIARTADVATLLERISVELNGAAVRIETEGTITAKVNMSASTKLVETVAEQSEEVSVHVSRPGAHAEELITSVSPHFTPFAKQVLSASVPLLRSLLAESNLADLRASLPIMSVASLVSSAHLESLEAPSVSESLLAFEKQYGQTFRAVCILSAEQARVASSLHYLWANEVGDVPLVRFSDGWLAFVPVRAGADAGLLLDPIRAKLHNNQHLRVRIGVSGEHQGVVAVYQALQEAWIAAQVADAGGEGALLSFEKLAPNLIARIIPVSMAQQLFETMYPKLATHEHVHEVATTVLTYLDANGSMATVAQRLGVHRNTVQSRLQKASELGVDLTKFDEVLPLHMLLAGIQAADNES